MRHTSVQPVLVGLALLAGCQKAAPEPPAATSTTIPAPTPEAAPVPDPVVVAMGDDIPALPLIPAGQVIADLPPATPLGELPLAIAPAQVAEEIKPELAAAFEKLFEPGLEGDQWEAVHLSLVEAGGDAVPVLRQALESKDVARREQASSILSLLGAVGEPAVPQLLKGLKDDSAFVRATSAAALASFSAHQEKAKTTLLELLDSKDPELRRLAATNLSILGESASDLVPRLTLALDDADSEVVRPIAQLLGQIGGPARAAVPRLQQIAFEKQGEVKEAATLAVELIEGRSEATSK
ncbi:HEAT repeat protein [Caulifigura coniformis]|uniref:HEAT repeat protein n=1 Tax=Caulifigura coniformis TaxID=2527983 RepID=A0A517SGF6_9PLAN|nr:HEAT repeat domain-containing protein [Caulifigura coniformis]QDT55201.1 HEAT repeat protein [Caulifigura coniformis]